MQAYASAQLTPLESESLQPSVASINPVTLLPVGRDVSAQRSGAASPISVLASLVLDGLSDQDLGVLARRLLPHLRQPVEADSSVPAAYTVASLAAQLGISEKAIRCAIARRELAAVKRGVRWLISAEAVRDWASPSEPRAQRRRARLADAPRAAGPSLRSVLCAAASSGGQP